MVKDLKRDSGINNKVLKQDSFINKDGYCIALKQ